MLPAALRHTAGADAADPRGVHTAGWEIARCRGDQRAASRRRAPGAGAIRAAHALASVRVNVVWWGAPATEDPSTLHRGLANAVSHRDASARRPDCNLESAQARGRCSTTARHGDWRCDSRVLRRRTRLLPR